MALTLDHFVAASAGHTNSEVYLKRQNGGPEGARLEIRGKFGRFVAISTQLRRNRAETAQAFHDAVLEKIHTKVTLLQGTGESAHSLYQRSLRNLAEDIKASLDAQMRGERALTANDIQVLTSRLNRKLDESATKARDVQTAEVNKRASTTLPEAQARISSAWASLCPGQPRPNGYPQMIAAINAYCATRPDIAQEKLILITEHLARAGTVTVGDLPIAQALAEELEDLHKGLFGYSVDLAVKRDTFGLNLTTPVNRGSFGALYKQTINGETKAVKTLMSGGPYYVELDKSPGASLQNPKLSRDKEVTAAYFKDSEKTFIMAPTHYLINEDHPHKQNIENWVVEVRDKEFRAWAKDQLIKNKQFDSYRLTIVGLIQDWAEGFELHQASEAGAITSDMIQPIAISYMNALIAMAKRGFVHGDIKPSNAFFDPATNRLKLIDTGGLTKISKDDARESQTLFVKQRGITDAFSLPTVVGDEKVGFEQDLFSTGVTILMLSLKQRGMTAAAEEMLFHFQQNASAYANNSIDKARALNEVSHYLDRNLVPNATPQERVAINVIKKAVELSSFGYVSDGTNYIPQLLEDFKNQF